MNPLRTALIHILLAIILFFSMGWLGRRSVSYGYQALSLYEKTDYPPGFNALFRVLTPLVFLILAASILYIIELDWAVRSIWRVVAYYFVLRFTFIFIKGHAALLPWPRELLMAGTSTTLAVLLARHILRTRSALLPDPSTLANELWIVIILFLYQLFNTSVSWDPNRERRQSIYVKRVFGQLRARYGSVVSGAITDPWVQALTYSILIYETFNRSRIERLIESYVLFPLGLSKTLGLAQVRTDKRISDEESVEQGAAIIAEEYARAVGLKSATPPDDPESKSLDIWDRLDIARTVALKYNPSSSYAEEIVGIYEGVLEQFYKDLWLAAFPTAPAEPDSY